MLIPNFFCTTDIKHKNRKSNHRKDNLSHSIYNENVLIFLLKSKKF